MSGGIVEIEFLYLEHGEGLPHPVYETPASAGMDLRAALPADKPLTLDPGEKALVPTGFAMALPVGYEAQVRPRSGLAAKNGVSVLNTPGTIDADYRGEVKVILVNFGSVPFVVERGMRIAQMIIAPITVGNFNVVKALAETERGAGGFGSTGKK
jgi:dUTP diphosphatase